MKLAYFYDSVRKVDPGDPGAEPADSPRRVELAKSVVRDLLDEYDRLSRYERQYGPNMEDEKGDARALEVLRSFWQMFEGWVNEAEPVYQSVKDVPSLRGAIPNLDKLHDDIIFARLRLGEQPEDELESVRLLRRGEGIRTTVQELRDELRARRGA